MPLSIVEGLHYDSINDLSWQGHELLVIASSDGFCSFIKLEESLIGKPLPTDSETIPETLRQHYLDLEKVNFERNMESAKNQKNSGFAKIAFRSKKSAVVTSNAPLMVPQQDGTQDVNME